MGLSASIFIAIQNFFFNTSKRIGAKMIQNMNVLALTYLIFKEKIYLLNMRKGDIILKRPKNSSIIDEEFRGLFFRATDFLKIHP